MIKKVDERARKRKSLFKKRQEETCTSHVLFIKGTSNMQTQTGMVIFTLVHASNMHEEYHLSPKEVCMGCMKGN